MKVIGDRREKSELVSTLAFFFRYPTHNASVDNAQNVMALPRPPRECITEVHNMPKDENDADETWSRDSPRDRKRTMLDPTRSRGKG